MNFFVDISVYSSAYDHKGVAMPLAQFMNLGKDHAADIAEYRSLKVKMSEDLERIEASKQYQAELSAVISSEENPLGGEDTPSVVAKKSELEDVKHVIEDLEHNIQVLKNRLDAIKRSFPCATLSGLFSPTRAKANIVHHSGFICVDIDDHYVLTDSQGKKHSYQLDVSGAKSVVSSMPWVCYAAHSVGGRGYFALVPLGPIDDSHTHEWYFDCLKAEFEQYGIIIDPACRDTTRLRFISYDENPYRNPAAIPYTGQQRFVSRNERNRIRHEEEARHAQLLKNTRYRDDKDDPEKDFVHIVACTDEAVRRGHFSVIDGYNEWVALGMALATIYGERGRIIFDQLSSCSKGYNSSLVQKKYDNFIRRGTPPDGKVPTIKTIFKFFHDEGIFWWKL